MRDGEKSSTGQPTIIVILLAVLGLATMPQGGGKNSESPPKASTSAMTGGNSQEASDDEKTLGPLAAIKADRGHLESLTTYPSCKVAVAQKSNATDEDVSILRSEPFLQFLVVLVPDPDNASMSHEFDLTLSAVQRATESAGFVAVRWSGMPGFPPARKSSGPETPKHVLSQIIGTLDEQKINVSLEAKTSAETSHHWPASILCRPTLAAKEQVRDNHSLLLVLLVPESPTSGVNKERLKTALELTEKHKEIHKDCKHVIPLDHSIRIIGPNFSGSIRSMAAVLSASKIEKKETYVVYNGRATAPNLKHFEDMSETVSITFRSTLYDSKFLDLAVRRFVKQITPTWPLAQRPRFAVLVESNTSFGQQSVNLPKTEADEKSGPIPVTKAAETRVAARAKTVSDEKTINEEVTDYFSFPLNVSQIREEYVAKGFLRTSEPVKLQSPERLTPLEMAGQRGEHDLIPVVTPGPSTVAAELTISQILMALERGRYNWVGIVATNSYDRLFLAEKVRVSCPNVRLYFMNSSTLYAHHTAVPYLRGTLIASTYPLDPDSQTWTASPGRLKNGILNRQAFGNFYEEGIYNAAVAHLSDLKIDDEPNFLDYAHPGSDDSYQGKDFGNPRAPSKYKTVPSVWISVVGQRGIYPVTVLKPEESWVAPSKPGKPNIGGLYVSHSNEKLEIPDPTLGVLDASWVGVFLTVVFSTIAMSLWYFRASRGESSEESQRSAVLSAGRRERFNHPSARRLAALAVSAGFGQLILLSAPILALVSQGGHWIQYLLGFLLVLFVGHAALIAIDGLSIVLVPNRWREMFPKGRYSARFMTVCLGVLTFGVVLILALFFLGAHRGFLSGLLALAFLGYLAAMKSFNVAISRLRPVTNAGTENGVERTYRWIIIIVSVIQVELSLGYVFSLLVGSSQADLRNYVARAMRLVDGVSPLIPMLFLGLAGAVVMLGDWRRIGMRIRLRAIFGSLTTVPGRLTPAWAQFSAARDSLEGPAVAWRKAGWRELLPLSIVPALIGVVFAGDLPKVFEPQVTYQWMFLFAFGATVALLSTRFIDMLLIARAIDQFLRRMAELPLAHALDRVPEQLARENIWRPGANESRAEEDSDPRIDRQFEAVVTNYQSIRKLPAFSDQAHFADASTQLDEFRLSHRPPDQLPIAQWWKSVTILSPFLEPFWAARPAFPTPTLSSGDKKTESEKSSDWGGLEDQRLTSWLRSVEDLIAMILARQVAFLRAAMDSVIGFLVVGLLSTTIVLTSYPFEPQGPMFGLIGALTLITVGAILVIAVQANRDEVLSRFNKTATDRFTFDSHFLTTMITFVAPLLGLLGALSYSLSDLFRSLFEPFFRSG